MAPPLYWRYLFEESYFAFLMNIINSMLNQLVLGEVFISDAMHCNHHNSALGESVVLIPYSLRAD